MGDKTAVIYARVSSTGERQSTERQVKDLSDYALYRQMDVRKVFEEHISGAKKNEERPVLCEAIAYCKEHRISTLLVSELSRMGCNAFEVLASVKELLDCGIRSAFGRFARKEPLYPEGAVQSAWRRWQAVAVCPCHAGYALDLCATGT